jgi:hypothetical protein
LAATALQRVEGADQEQWSEAVGVEQRSISNWIEEFSKNGNSANISKLLFQDDFDPPICNVWKVQDKAIN